MSATLLSHEILLLDVDERCLAGVACSLLPSEEPNSEQASPQRAYNELDCTPGVPLESQYHCMPCVRGDIHDKKLIAT